MLGLGATLGQIQQIFVQCLWYAPDTGPGDLHTLNNLRGDLRRGSIVSSLSWVQMGSIASPRARAFSQLFAVLDPPFTQVSS